jgi:hypothetical protein
MWVQDAVLTLLNNLTSDVLVKQGTGDYGQKRQYAPVGISGSTQSGNQKSSALSRQVYAYLWTCISALALPTG